MTGATLKNWIALICAMFWLTGFQISNSSANPPNPANTAHPESTIAASNNEVQNEDTLKWHRGVVTKSIYVDKVSKQTLIEINKIPYVLSQKVSVRVQSVVQSIRHEEDTTAGSLSSGQKVLFEAAGTRANALISRIVVDLVRKGD